MQTGIYLFKVNKGNSRKLWEICFTDFTYSSDTSIVDFEQVNADWFSSVYLQFLITFFSLFRTNIYVIHFLKYWSFYFSKLTKPHWKKGNPNIRIWDALIELFSSYCKQFLKEFFSIDDLYDYQDFVGENFNVSLTSKMVLILILDIFFLCKFPYIICHKVWSVLY